MKQKVSLFIALAISTSVFIGCKKINGKGAIVSQTYDLSGFEKIDLSNTGDVVTVYDVNQYVEVKTHENLFEALEIKVDNGRLKIDTKKGYSIGKYDELTYYVHSSAINEVNVSGSGNILVVDGTSSTGSFKATISGSGSVTAENLSVSTAEANISGSGNTHFDGQTNQANLKISGSGNIYSFGLISQSTDANISGSGNIETTTNNSLDVSISGSGNVKYKGTPVIDVNISGSGNITNAN